MVHRCDLLPNETRFHVYGCNNRLVFSVYCWFELSNTLDKTFVIEAIQKAIKRYGKPEIMNSDQGSQFTSDDYINLLKNNGIKISMDGKGRALDNQRIERFFRSYKWRNFILKSAKRYNNLDKSQRNMWSTITIGDRTSHWITKHRQSITLEDMTSYWQLYRIMGLRPKPVLTGRQPVCHNRPESKRIYVQRMSRVR